MGFLITDDLVLTSPSAYSSKLPDDIEIARVMTFAGGAVSTGAAAGGTADGGGPVERYSCRIAWSSPSTDIALLRIDDNHWAAAERLPPPRFGVFTGGLDWTSGTIVAARELAVDLNPQNRRRPYHWDLRLAANSGPLSEAADVTGAALFAGELLSGVVIREEAGPRLTAVALASAAREPGFRNLVENATGQRLRLAPIELEDMLRRWLPATGPLTPADLLDPARGLPPFRGRREFLRRLTDWCTDGAALAGMLITGPAGVGKTRLARQLAENLEDDGWLVGELSGARPTDRWLRHLERVDRPTLLIADEVEEDPRPAQAIAEHLARHPTRAPMRMILLARDAGWWDRWRALLGSAVVVFAAAPECLTDPESDLNGTDRSGTERDETGGPHEIAASFAVGLGMAFEPADPRPTPDSARTGQTASGTRMAALASLLTGEGLGAGQGAGSDGADEPAFAVTESPIRAKAVLVARALRDWAGAYGRPDPTDPAGSAWLDVIGVALLHTPVNRATAIDLVADLPGLGGPGTREMREKLADRLHELYPPRNPNRAYWGRPLSGQLAEHYLGAHPAPSVLLDVVARLGPADADVALARLARAAASSPTLAELLRDLVIGHAETLGPPAITAAARVDASQPLLSALERIAGLDFLQTPVFEQLANALPTPAGKLVGVAVALRERLVRDLETAYAITPGSGRAELGRQWTILSSERAELGRPDEALTAARRAVDLLRQTRESGPVGSTVPGLLAALRNESARHAALGQAEQALALAVEEVRESRALIEDDPARCAHPDLLADALVHLARRLHPDRRDDTVAALEEAVAVYSGLDGSDRLIPLCHTLRLLSDRQADAGLSGPSAATMGACVLVCERLAQDEPAAYVPRLAAALEVLAERHRRAGETAAAVQAAEQAVTAYRRVARTRPHDELPQLIRALSVYSNLLAEAGRPDDAVAAAQAGVAHAREHAQRGYPADLAAALNTLMIRWDEVGAGDRAGDVAVELVRIHRRPVDNDDGQHRLALAYALVNLAARRGAVGDLDQAHRAADDAVEILTAQPDDGSAIALAAALNNRAIILGELGGEPRLAEAVRDATNAVQLLSARSHGHAEEYARALATLGLRRDDAGDRAGGIEALEHAVRLRQGTADEFTGPDGVRHAVTLIGLAQRYADSGDPVRAARTARQCWTGIAPVRQIRPDLLRDEAAAVCALLARLPRDVVPRTESMSAALEAVARYRELAGVEPSHYFELLADALATLADLLDAEGEHEDSIKAAHEEVAIRTSLAQAGQTRSVAAQATALRLLADRYDTAGTRPLPDDVRAAYQQGALTAAQEAYDASLRIREDKVLKVQAAASAMLLSYLLARSQPAPPREALSLANVSVAWYRDSAADRPETYLVELAGALVNRSTMQARLNMPKATADAREAVGYLRDISAQRPEYREDLARALMNLASCTPLIEVRARCSVYDEVVTVYESLDADDPATYRMPLLNALDVLTDALQSAGRQQRGELQRRRAQAQSLIGRQT